MMGDVGLQDLVEMLTLERAFSFPASAIESASYIVLRGTTSSQPEPWPGI